MKLGMKIYYWLRRMESRYFHIRNALILRLRGTALHSGGINNRKERNTDNESQTKREQQEFRYLIASLFIHANDVVLDAACGEGQGRKFIRGTYIGVDKEPKGVGIMAGDLEDLRLDFDYDVFIGFEIIEHLYDYTNFIEIAKKAKKAILISTPIVPTIKRNQFHVHDFHSRMITKLFTDDVWYPYQRLIQQESGIWIFKRRR